MQLRQGQARRVVVKLRPVHNSGQLPLMLEEVVADTKIGRMEGPFAAPASWGFESVRPDVKDVGPLLDAPEGAIGSSHRFQHRPDRF